MVIMAVDYGDSRTGIACCDKLMFMASPVEVISQKYAPKVADRIAVLANERKAELIVVGLPKNMDGSEGERAEKCRRFAQLIAEKTGIKTELVDERLTTVEAHDILSNVNVRGKKRKNVVDAVAAVLILESYMRSIKNN